MNDLTCSFCKDPNFQTIRQRIGLQDGNWCLGCLAQKAYSLANELAEMDKKIINFTLRGKELIAATAAISNKHDKILEKYMELAQEKIIRERDDAQKKI